MEIQSGSVEMGNNENMWFKKKKTANVWQKIYHQRRTNGEMKAQTISCKVIDQ